MSTYTEDGGAYFAERPEPEPPDFTKDDHAEAARVNREQVSDG